MFRWVLFIVLSLIWGSSFILMKLGLDVLTPFEVAAIRMLSAGTVLLPFLGKAIKNTPSKSIPFMFISGLLGSFFPAILFCLAETSIDSAMAAILNATTPLFVLLVGVIFFKRGIHWKQILGIGLGLSGVILLMMPTLNLSSSTFGIYAFFILFATVMYGFNVNIANQFLMDIKPLYVTTLSFVMLIPFDIIILWKSGFATRDFTDITLIRSLGSSFVLGVLGTAFATWLFYRLMQEAGPLFSSMVTYGIPFVAIGWGILAGEQIGFTALIALALILLGIYLSYKKKSP